MCLRNILFCAVSLMLRSVTGKAASAAGGLFTPQGIKAQLEKYRVVPELVQVPPQEEIGVEYEGGLLVQMGNFLPVKRLGHEPNISYHADPNKYYTLTLVDMDFLNIMITHRVEYQLWCILNIPGNNVTEGELLTEYKQPKPSKAHAYHRYVFSLWEHDFIHFRELRVRTGQLPIYRENFNTAKFMDKYELPTPKAMNFFRTCPPADDYEDDEEE